MNFPQTQVPHHPHIPPKPTALDRLSVNPQSLSCSTCAGWRACGSNGQAFCHDGCSILDTLLYFDRHSLLLFSTLFTPCPAVYLKTFPLPRRFCNSLLRESLRSFSLSLITCIYPLAVPSIIMRHISSLSIGSWGETWITKSTNMQHRGVWSVSSTSNS